MLHLSKVSEYAMAIHATAIVRVIVCMYFKALLNERPHLERRTLALRTHKPLRIHKPLVHDDDSTEERACRWYGSRRHQIGMLQRAKQCVLQCVEDGKHKTMTEQC